MAHKKNFKRLFILDTKFIIFRADIPLPHKLNNEDDFSQHNYLLYRIITQSAFFKKKTLQVSLHTGHNQARINKKDDSQISRTVHRMTLITLYDKTLFHRYEKSKHLNAFPLIYSCRTMTESKHVAFYILYKNNNE